MRILLVEDNHVDVMRLKSELGATSASFAISHVETLADATQILETETFDIILLDLGLPDSRGLETFLEMKRLAPNIPVVVMSGLDDETLAIDAVANGAQDYICKDRWDCHLIVRSLNYAIERDQILNEHKQATEIAQRKSRALEVLSGCNEVLVRANDEFAFLGDICRIIVEKGGYSMAWVGYAANDEAKTVHPVAMSGFDDEFLQEVDVSWDENRTTGRGPMGVAIRTGKIQTINDISTDSGFNPWREIVSARGCGAVVVLPLIVNGDPIGGLSIWANESDAFHNEEVDLLSQLADDLSYGIGSIRSRAEKEEAEQALRDARQRLELALNGAALVTWDQDLETDEVVIGENVFDILGVSSDEVSHAESWKNLIHEDDLPLVLSAVDAHLKGETPAYEAEYRLRAKSGEWKWILSRGRIVERDVNGKPLRTAGTFLDVSSYRQAQEALSESENRFRAVFERAEDYIFIKDSNLRYVQVNPALAQSLGKAPSDFVGRTAEDVYGAEAGLLLRDIELRVLRGQSLEGERTFPIDGIPVVYNYSITPLTDAAGKVTGIFGIAKDVTDRRTTTQRYSTKTADEYPSRAMQATLSMARRIARQDSVVLLLGESGSGKDYVAKYIHDLSRRSNGPYFSLNCAAIASHLAESELFGHERGAFTGAVGRKRGMLELAEGGSLLLNEIGELSLALQAKLLTFLDTRKFTRVGGEKEISVSARIMAATNRDLEKEVEEGGFRRDLFYRFNVIRINIPPLRERLEDIPVLADEITSRLASEMQLTSIPPLGVAALKALTLYNWPGNVRELRNVLERALIVSGGKSLDPMLPVVAEGPKGQAIKVDFRGRTLRDVTDELTRSMCLDALQRSHGNKREAAKLLGIARDSLYRYLKQFGVISEDRQ